MPKMYTIDAHRWEESAPKAGTQSLIVADEIAFPPEHRWRTDGHLVF